MGGEEEALAELERKMIANPLVRGITLSGGDPFLQAADCAALAGSAHAHGLDVWTYTGYTWETILAAHDPAWEALLAATDVLVDGPFVLAQKSYAALFRGSSNQRLIDVHASRKAGQVVLWHVKDTLAHFVRPAS
jgi:anaerobic ribonucleoside-triphosphate reductase activating protein